MAEVSGSMRVTRPAVGNKGTAGRPIRMTVIAVLGCLCAGPASGISVDQQIGNQVGRSVSQSVATNIAAAVIKPKLKIRNQQTGMRDWTASADARFIAMTYQDGSARIWDFKKSIQSGQLPASGKPIGAFVVSNLGTLYYAARGQRGVLRFRAGSAPEVIPTTASFGAIRLLGISADESFLAAVGDEPKRLQVLDLRSGAVIEKIEASAHIEAVAVSPGGSTVAYATGEPALHRWDSVRSRTGRLALSPQGRLSLLRYDSTAKAVVAVSGHGVVTKWTDGSAAADATRPLWQATATSVTYAEGARVIGAVFDNEKAQLFDLRSGKTAGGHSSPISASRLLLVDRGRHLMSADVSEIVKVQNAQTRTPVAQIISTRTGWAVIDYEGRYDGSESALRDVIWEAGDLDLPLENFFDTYFEPGLLARHMDPGTDLSRVPRAVPEGVALPPVVEIDFPPEAPKAKADYQFVVVADDKGGGIGAVRLYHNGKLAPPGALVHQEDYSAEDKHLRLAAYRVKILPGPNTFHAVATNVDGVEGAPIRITKVAAGQPARGVLHVVGVGINDYADPDLALAYSVPDATAIARSLGSAGRKAYQSIRTQTVLNDQANRDQLKRVLSDLRATTEADSVVLYLAGHGVAAPDEWFFLPQDTPAAGARKPAQLARSALSSGALQEALVEIKAHRIMLMIDACFSGAGVDSFYRFQHFQRKFSRRISRSAGITVLAATREDQRAAELGTLGHGLFTFVLLQGLNGGADMQPRDGTITAHELLSYSSTNIPRLAQRFVGASQDPTAFALGADFILRQP